MTTRTRRYTSPLRADQARLTRRRVLEAAHRLFVTHGYSGTTLDAVAREAGVSLQTVYNAVGNKAALLTAAYDVTLAGDDQPVPIAQRPSFEAVLAATDATTCLALYAGLSRDLGERAAPLVAVILAEAGNPDVQTLAQTIEQQRAQGTAGVAGHIAEHFELRPQLTRTEAADILWSLTAPEIPIRLVTRRGWTWDRYQSWLADTMTRTLL